MDNKTKLMNQLNVVYHFYKDGDYSLKDYFSFHKPLEKIIVMKNHTDHRIHLEYKKINDKIEYFIGTNNGLMIKVSKLIYDSFQDLPERIINNRF